VNANAENSPLSNSANAATSSCSGARTRTRRLIKHALERYPDVEAARKQMTDVANRATS
jgi:hypothetical protein